MEGIGESLRFGVVMPATMEGGLLGFVRINYWATLALKIAVVDASELWSHSCTKRVLLWDCGVTVT